ncbi:hypothetical protein CFC21_029090 [Triticum aestivum]|uniref:Small acidic protein-like domain-containing protein n=3 Tax=Triticinae TaxID=1648030 RepID=A0A453B8J6_AEGTS|nr:peptidyl-prolyl cis-trans isomerase G isoform X1 [Aegilops tauschii subsp. strangulata]XP_040254487.1 peptidyl-prolyl cis-trans isomerase G isoform X1 [Aegilops tauschii subsp. strangulata]XP_044331416.1 peptidyl-prolyl cis-trans isomerase G-like isoform X1 [Triticum aestivum]XP_044331417.1 peptidyl-prolyl cis-trans isomerase G-like isoform X1 [Triticum aestivum]KAF7015190.1 hypothetical protein CFC21_029090 [Triticum aestivum]
MDTKRGRSRSPVEIKDGHSKGSENGRKDNSALQNDSSHARPGRVHEFVRHSDRHSYGAPRESRRHDDYRRYHNKRADDNDRSHSRTSRSDRESRADTYYYPSKRDDTSDRSHGDWRNVDSKYGGKSVKGEQRTKNQEKHGPPREYPRHGGTEYDKDADLRKETNSTRRHPEEKESKNKEKFKQEDALKKRSGKEIEKSSCAAEPELETREKRRSLFSSVGPGVENAQHMEMDTSGGNKDETMNDLNAAKVAAMKAAESVKKNILGFGVGTGRLSTDQKKKLLWGNKKSNPTETSTHWDSNLFSDRERQEKFNKLMSLRVPWWLWPIVGCEEQCLCLGSREQGCQQGGRSGGSQETGGARHRSGETLRSRPAPEGWPNCWPRPVGSSGCECGSNQDLKCLLCGIQFIGSFILACGNLIVSFASKAVELGYCDHLVAHEHLLCLIHTV